MQDSPWNNKRKWRHHYQNQSTKISTTATFKIAQASTSSIPTKNTLRRLKKTIYLWRRWHLRTRHLQCARVIQQSNNTRFANLRWIQSSKRLTDSFKSFAICASVQRVRSIDCLQYSKKALSTSCAICVKFLGAHSAIDLSAELTPDSNASIFMSMFLQDHP